MIARLPHEPTHSVLVGLELDRLERETAGTTSANPLRVAHRYRMDYGATVLRVPRPSLPAVR